MGRRNKNIEVEINETKQNQGDTTDLEVVVKKKVIGTVHQTKGEPVKVTYKEGKSLPARTVEEGIQSIIAEYNLHDQ